MWTTLKKFNTNFSILGLQNAKQLLKGVSTYINSWTTMKFGFDHQKIKMKKKKKSGCPIFHLRLKYKILVKFTLCNLSCTLIWNFMLLWKVVLKILLTMHSKIQKNIAGSMSQSLPNWHNKNNAPFSCSDIFFLPWIFKLINQLVERCNHINKYVFPY